MCGEKIRNLHITQPTSGSPPRVRGEGKGRHSDQTADRITPACAGRRTTSELRPRVKTDHPRVCGEKYRNCID